MASEAGTFAFGRGKSILFSSELLRLALFALLALFVLSALPPTHAQISVFHNGTKMEFPLAQLWYDGYWKEVPSFNGTAVKYGRGDVRGKIAYFVGMVAPHESRIAAAQRAGAVAALFYRISRSDHPGTSMFFIDGSDRKRLKIPVFEAVVRTKTHAVFSFPDGHEVQLRPQPNLYAQKGRGHFQIFANLFQSFMELAIVCVGLYRIRQFWCFTQGTWRLLAIGPMCIVLEMIGALLRLAYTCVDPFFTWRMMPYGASLTLVTVSFPFSLTAGILLAFFWAETLSTSNVEAKGFLSRYRIPAAITIVALFLVEIICNILRALFEGKLSISPNYISIALYLVVSVSLIIFYLVVTARVIKRLQEMQHNRRAKLAIRVMAARVATSTSGYAMFTIGFILYVLFASRAWGLQLSLNLVFFGENVAGLLQVIAIRPIRASKKRAPRYNSNGTTGPTLGIESPEASKRNSKSATATEPSYEDIDSESDDESSSSSEDQSV